MKFVLQGSQPVQILHRGSLCAETQLPLGLSPLSALPRDGGDIRAGILRFFWLRLFTDQVFPGRRGFLSPAFFRECLAGLDIPSGFPAIYGHSPVSSCKKTLRPSLPFPKPPLLSAFGRDSGPLERLPL